MSLGDTELLHTRWTLWNKYAFNCIITTKIIIIIIIILPKAVNIKKNAVLSLIWCRGAGGIFGANRNPTDENTPISEKPEVGSPRGKIITNVADDQVDLTLEDIPGASFSEEEIEKLTVAQLKFWLKCRRINQDGNKKELLERR